MTKHASMILALACATVGIGAAEAQSRIQTGHRVPTISADYRTKLPQRPEMQSQNEGYSYCDDSDGGLACGFTECMEFEGGQVSSCITYSQNQTDPDD